MPMATENGPGGEGERPLDRSMWEGQTESNPDRFTWQSSDDVQVTGEGVMTPEWAATFTRIFGHPPPGYDAHGQPVTDQEQEDEG